MSRGSRIGIGIGLAILLVGGVLGARWLSATRHAVAIGSAMLAKQVCSCVFIAGRSLDECRADQMASLDAIPLELRREEGVVRTGIEWLAEARAVYLEGLGCHVD